MHFQNIGGTREEERDGGYFQLAGTDIEPIGIRADPL